MAAFKGYEKMDESTSSWILPKKKGTKKGPTGKFSTTFPTNLDNVYVATEKAHGSNFCFIVNGNSSDQVTFAKRTGIIEENDSFFGFRSILSDVLPKVTKLFSLYEQTAVPQNSKLKVLYLFGELIGGGYTGSENTKEDPHHPIELVQPEILYSPWLTFYAFDIKTDLTNVTTQAVTSQYTDYNVCVDLFEKTGLFYAKPLVVGSLEQCLAFPVEFETTLPARLGLLSLGKSNQAEGVVIKAVKDVSVQTSTGKSTRAIVKNKAQRFQEKVLQTGKEKAKISSKFIGEELIKEELAAYITVNRLRSATSKIGKVTLSNDKAVQKLQTLLIQDVMASFQDDNATLHSAFQKMDAKKQQEITAYVEKAVSKLITSSLK